MSALNPAPKSISKTVSGRKWLSNFRPEEIDDAAALLDAIANISSTTFRNDMKRLLLGVRETVGDAKVAAFSVRGVPQAMRATGFFTNALSIPRGTGSELIVENVLSKTKKATGFLLEPDVETMCRKRIDVILFVADTLGSGSEAFQFMSYFAANPSIRSWLSSKHVRFELATHSPSDSSWAWLERDRRWSAIHMAQPGRDFDTAGWSPDQKKRIVDLCEKYSDGRSDSLGYRGISHLTVFDHTVGNGLPRILLQRVGPRNGPWIPLLPHDRAFGLDAEMGFETADYVPPRTPEAIIESLSAAKTPKILQAQEKIALTASEEAAFRPVILYLVCLRLGIVQDFQIMRHAKMTQRRMAEIRQYSIEMALTTSQNQLTESGRELIRKFGREPVRLVSVIHREMTGPYYPSQLR